MSFVLTAWLVLMLFENEVFCKEDTRRFLANDSNFVVQQELSIMKATLQDQQSKITQLQQDGTIQENKLVQLEKNNTLLGSTIVQLQSDVAQLESDNTFQANIIMDLQGDLSRYLPSAFGAVYTRWGRKECPDNETELVYSGIVGGSNYDQTSSASEYVCLPKDPTWKKYNDTLQDYRAKMYGGEYQEDFYRSGLRDSDVPCAVCRRHFASSAIMLPGRNQCYRGWRMEYEGYLASGGLPTGQFGNKAASQFVCLDSNPEVIFNSSRNDDGKFFFMVEGICGSLPCPPYVNGRELTCSVCTK